MLTHAEQERTGYVEEAAALDLWVKRALKDRYGLVVREKLPDDLLELLGPATPEH